VKLRVADNLVSNAVKFTPSGGHALGRLARADARVRLSVSDTGKGIRAEFLPHIFERFRQADSTSTRGQAGLGLGLAIARHIVDLHHGGIHAARPSTRRSRPPGVRARTRWCATSPCPARTASP
jgi:signal transduction histidine kinase